MSVKSFYASPFYRYLPVPWEMSSTNEPVYSLTRTHGLQCRIACHNIQDPINHELPLKEKVLISYEVNGRHYDLYTVEDMLQANYAFDDIGLSNMRGDLAERIARRIVKRFLQTFDRGFGKIGGLFDKRFNPKKSMNFVVSNTNRYVLKIGKYPNMILLEKTGMGKWGYQHVTDLDGLFDYRYAHQRHLLIMESKAGRIDVQPDHLYRRLFTPLRKLFPGAHFSYVLMAERAHLLDEHNREFRILQSTPLRIYKGLREKHIPCFFFEFKENESDFQNMCQHLVTNYRALNNQTVTFHGRTIISDDHITIFNAGSPEPFLVLERDPGTGTFHQVVNPMRQPETSSSG